MFSTLEEAQKQYDALKVENDRLNPLVDAQVQVIRELEGVKEENASLKKQIDQDGQIFREAKRVADETLAASQAETAQARADVVELARMNVVEATKTAAAHDLEVADLRAQLAAVQAKADARFAHLQNIAGILKPVAEYLVSGDVK